MCDCLVLIDEIHSQQFPPDSVDRLRLLVTERVGLRVRPVLSLLVSLEAGVDARRLTYVVFGVMGE